MDDNRVSVERIPFGEYEMGVTEALEEYHESVADGFLEVLSRRDVRDEFVPETYVARELEKDVTYLETTESREPLVVALDGDRVVGCVYLYELSEGKGEVKRLYVRAAYRGRGLGRELMESLIEYADEEDYAMLRLDTAADMETAQTLYRALGFESFDGGESVSDIPTPILDDITYMKLSLSGE